jgi:ABC-type oligopeptide transport system ATPase subunit
MAQAIAVRDVVKKFGKPGGSFWKQVLGPKTNGDKPVVMAVDDVSFDVQEGD